MHTRKIRAILSKSGNVSLQPPARITVDWRECYAFLRLNAVFPIRNENYSASPDAMTASQVISTGARGNLLVATNRV
jgi:hypothetical protein